MRELCHEDEDRGLGVQIRIVDNGVSEDAREKTGRILRPWKLGML
jgi:uncharacterized caspase-like protein